jgi:hypothetical protein
MKDPIYAIGTYLETEDRTQGGFVPFKLFPRQIELVNGYMKYQHNIVMKPRQAGISTTTAAFAAILTALASKKAPEKILIAANKQETAKEFLKKIRDFTSQLPDWMDVNNYLIGWTLIDLRVLMVGSIKKRTQVHTINYGMVLR